ncbi:MAG: hypothetical protein AVDCRST_MAG45-1397, partial [uncultured Solirubrobacterales bacterium]
EPLRRHRQLPRRRCRQPRGRLAGVPGLPVERGVVAARASDPRALGSLLVPSLRSPAHAASQPGAGAAAGPPRAPAARPDAAARRDGARLRV